jgi:ribosome-binding protein aMBF1 (putative translation factor)
MLSKHNSIQRDKIETIALDELVPANHLIRKMEAAIDFSLRSEGTVCAPRRAHHIVGGTPTK